MSRRRRHHQIVFGAQSHGFTACSLRLKAASQPTNQGSLPVTGQVLPGGIQTHRVSIETFLCFHVFFHFYLFPSLWALAGATSVLASQASTSLPSPSLIRKSAHPPMAFDSSAYKRLHAVMARGTLALPGSGSALRHFGSFLLVVLIPLVSRKNPQILSFNPSLPLL